MTSSTYSKGGTKLLKGGTKLLKGGTKLLKGGTKLLKGGTKLLKGGTKLLKGGTKLLKGGTKLLKGGTKLLKGGTKSLGWATGGGRTTPPTPPPPLATGLRTLDPPVRRNFLSIELTGEVGGEMNVIIHAITLNHLHLWGDGKGQKHSVHVEGTSNKVSLSLPVTRF